MKCHCHHLKKSFISSTPSEPSYNTLSTLHNVLCPPQNEIEVHPPMSAPLTAECNNCMEASHHNVCRSDTLFSRVSKESVATVVYSLLARLDSSANRLECVRRSFMIFLLFFNSHSACVRYSLVWAIWVLFSFAIFVPQELEVVCSLSYLDWLLGSVAIYSSFWPPPASVSACIWSLSLNGTMSRWCSE